MINSFALFEMSVTIASTLVDPKGYASGHGGLNGYSDLWVPLVLLGLILAAAFYFTQLVSR